MNKKLLIVSGLALLSTSAMASKARMESLGQGTTSFYLMDSRSIFLNPAALNEMKNYVVAEWGVGTYVNSSSVTKVRDDAQTTPRAEGGFFREMGSFSYGLYFGNNGDVRTTAPASTASAGKEFLDQQNAIDLFLAGDMGLKWGARLHYANAKDESQVGTGSTAFKKENSALGIGLGVSHGDMDGYANVTLSDKSTGATVAGDEWKRKPGFQIGGSYKWTGMTFFADYASTNEEIAAGTGSGLTTVLSNTTDIAAGRTVTYKTSNITLGGARIHEVNPTSRVVADARLTYVKSEVGGSSTTSDNGSITTTSLPLTFALEVDANNWLTLRGSVSQNFILGEAKTEVSGGATTKATTANSTTVNAGATLNYGKLKLDGVIGISNSGSSSVTSGSTTTTTNTTGKSGVFSSNNLLSRVGVTYSF